MQSSVLTRPPDDLVVVSPAEVREHIRIADADEEGNLTLYVRSALASCADAGRIRFGEHTLRVRHPLDCTWRAHRRRLRYYLPDRPTAITAARLTGGSGTPQPRDLPADLFEFEASVQCFRWKDGWPEFANDFNTLEVDYVAGFTAEALAAPEHAELKFAVLETTADRYVNRAMGIHRLPKGAAAICRRYRHSPLLVDMYA